MGAREEYRSWSCQPRLSFLVVSRTEHVGFRGLILGCLFSTFSRWCLLSLSFWYRSLACGDPWRLFCPNNAPQVDAGDGPLVWLSVRVSGCSGSLQRAVLGRAKSLRADHRGGQNYRVSTLDITVALLFAASCKCGLVEALDCSYYLLCLFLFRLDRVTV